MNTYSLQLLFHCQSERTDDNRFDTFMDELTAVAERYCIAFDDHR